MVFEKDAAAHSFARVYALGKDTIPGRAASAVVPMDNGYGVEAGFKLLDKLIRDYPDEILIRWLYCIEARYFKTHVKEAELQFQQMLSEWDIAPVMVHQIYARLLTSELGQPEKALEHRMLAVEIEPGPVTYQGLANTYLVIGRYKEAELVYAKLLEMTPESSIDWIRWGNCLFFMEDYASASEKYENAFIKQEAIYNGFQMQVDALLSG